MNKIGVIYIGANSVKFTLMNVMDTGYYKIIDESNNDIKLAQDLIESNMLSDYKIDQTLSNVRSFKSLCKVSGVTDIIAVATCALRNANNCDAFLKQIKDLFDIDITLLSNEDEVNFTCLGITKSICVTNSLVVDICGACTHLTWIKDGQIINSSTIPFGSLNQTYQYHLEDRITSSDLENAISSVRKAIDDIEWIRKGEYDSIIGVGGTVRTLCKIDRAKKRYPCDILHNYTLTDYDVNQIYNLLKCKDYNQRVRVESLSHDRADLIVGGLTIFNTLIEHVQCEKIVVSGRGLREGIMFSYIEANYSKIQNVLDYNLSGIIDYLNINRSHAEHVFTMTSTLFHALNSLHKLGNSYDNVLKTSTLLHDSGVSIDYYHHHKHSFYVILNSNISGLSHRELIVSAAIAALHNNKSSISLLPYFSIINRIDIKAIDYISVLLSISEGLDRNIEHYIDSFNLSIEDESVIITLSSTLDLNLEITQALKVKDKFKATYGKELIIKQI